MTHRRVCVCVPGIKHVAGGQGVWSRDGSDDGQRHRDVWHRHRSFLATRLRDPHFLSAHRTVDQLQCFSWEQRRCSRCSLRWSHVDRRSAIAAVLWSGNNNSNNPGDLYYLGYKKKIIIIIIIIAMTMFNIVYGAVIMTKVIARVHPVHLMNVDWAPGSRQPSDQANRLGLWVCRKLAAIIHIHHRHWYYYSARKLILILPSHWGWKAEST